jgi:serine/threonine protein kinase
MGQSLLSLMGDYGRDGRASVSYRSCEAHSRANVLFHRLVSLPMVKSIIRQILSGLDYLHTSCGIVHTGAARSGISLNRR